MIPLQDPDKKGKDARIKRKRRATIKNGKVIRIKEKSLFLNIPPEKTIENIRKNRKSNRFNELNSL